MERVETKAAWRKWATSLTKATVAESDAVTDHVGRFVVSHGWKVVLTFLAMPGEVDLGGLDVNLDLMVTRTPRQGPLTIHRLTSDLETHPFGYRQPSEDAPEVAAESIEVVLVPGVLFGLDGSRLGHGKGYYDTLLAGFPDRPFLLGVSLDRRLVDGLPMTPSDVFMDAIVTESGVRLASSSLR